MEKRSRDFEERKALSSEPKSPSASDFAAGKPHRGRLVEMQEDQRKGQCTEDLRSVADSHLGASHPNARSERPISSERRPDWTESEPPFLILIRKYEEVAQASPKVAQDKWLNVTFAEKDASALREKFRRITLANEVSHAFCLRARGDGLQYAPASDEVIKRVDKLLNDVSNTYKQAVEKLTCGLNKKLQELLPEELRVQESFPKEYPEEIKTCIKDNLEAILSNKEVSQRRRCHFVESIREIGDKEVVPRLVEMLGDEGINRDVRESIGKAIGKLGDKEEVFKMLGDESVGWPLRESIAYGIGKSGDKEVVPRLVEMLGDQGIDWYERCRIAEAIGKLGDKEVVPHLVEMLSDQGIDRDVRCRIAEAIGKIGDKEVVPRLVEMLSDQVIDVNVRCGIVEAIGKFGDKEVVPRLFDKLDDGRIDPDVRDAINETIERSIN